MVLDLMDDAFRKILKDGRLILDEDFMISIFSSLKCKIKPFVEHFSFMFETKKSFPVGSHTETDCVLPWKMIIDELFVPTRKVMIQSNALCAILASELAL